MHFDAMRICACEWSDYGKIGKLHAAFEDRTANPKHIIPGAGQTWRFKEKEKRASRAPVEKKNWVKDTALQSGP